MLTWLVCATPALAQPDLSRTIGSTVADRASASYVFSALQLASADGKRQYRVRIAAPKTPAPAAGYPVVYLLDGNAALMELDAHLLDSLSTQGDAPVLVFIADDSALRIDAVGRSLDYTPARFGDGRVETDPLNPQRRTGGAAAFAQLIATRIRPQVEAHVAVDVRRQTLWGHSYGGLFVLHVLLTQPQLFQHYVAVDPSLWWGDGFLVQQAQRVVDDAQAASASNRPDKRRLTLMAGEGGTPANATNRSVQGGHRQIHTRHRTSSRCCRHYPASPPRINRYQALAMVRHWAHRSRQPYGTQRRGDGAIERCDQRSIAQEINTHAAADRIAIATRTPLR